MTSSDYAEQVYPQVIALLGVGILDKKEVQSMPKCKRRQDVLICVHWTGQNFRAIDAFCKKIGQFCHYTTDGATRVVSIYGNSQRIKVPVDHWVTYEAGAMYVFEDSAFNRLYEVIP